MAKATKPKTTLPTEAQMRDSIIECLVILGRKILSNANRRLDDALHAEHDGPDVHFETSLFGETLGIPDPSR
jgi:hypothetical protein